MTKMHRMGAFTQFWVGAAALAMTLISTQAWSNDSVLGGSVILDRFEATFEREKGSPAERAEIFIGSAGEATLTLVDLSDSRSKNIASATVMLNGETLLKPSDFRKKESTYELPVTLLAGANEITVKLAGKPGTRFDLQVQQEVSTGVTSRIHFNTQVSSFRDAREFYRGLGFNFSIDFPQTNTAAVARAIGIEIPPGTDFKAAEWEERLDEDRAVGFPIGVDGGYLLKGQLIGLPLFFARGFFIDLIEFTIPRRDDPPYEKINHLGMAMAAMETADIEYDYDYLVSNGIEVLAEPITNPDGERFAIFKDRDGVYYQLIETDSSFIDDDGDGERDIETNINRLGKVTINVSDLSVSVPFYERIGFQVVRDTYETGSSDVADALGMPSDFKRKGTLMALADGSQVELVEWINPFDRAPPYGGPVNHIGIGRIAFTVENITGAVEKLKQLDSDIAFVSEIAPCCTGDLSDSGIIAFYDPDGTVLEFTGPR